MPSMVRDKSILAGVYTETPFSQVLRWGRRKSLINRNNSMFYSDLSGNDIYRSVQKQLSEKCAQDESRQTNHAKIHRQQSQRWRKRRERSRISYASTLHSAALILMRDLKLL